MLENEFYISELIAGKLRGDLNPQQELRLNTWIALSDENRKLFNQLKAEDISREIKHFLSPDKDSVWQKTMQGIADSNKRYNEKTIQTNRSELRLWLRLGAAAIFFVIGFAIFFYMNPKFRMTKPEPTGAYANDIAPGTNGATLTLANGKKIKLIAAKNGQVASEAGVTITKTSGGQVVYEIVSKGTEQFLHTLSTTGGQQYQLILPDRSKVWLNAASSIKYPSSFAALKNRVIELNGEAYFEVAKDKMHPFIVKTAQQEVEVLGTHFNIYAYNNGEETKTTLLEGSVQLNGGILLKPNEQGTSSANGISVKVVNANDAIAWKQGDFIFKNQELTTTMRQIARWYNVAIIYEPNAPKQLKLGGSISRANQLSVVLKAMEKTGKVKFRLEGRRVIVSKV